MVTGLDVFREHFAGYEAYYVLIGGAACDVLMNDAGLAFRSTKDLDLVLCVEVLDGAFGQHLWQFIQTGGYQQSEKSAGQKVFYRFLKPANESYPAQLEFFSRTPAGVQLPPDAYLTPIPMEQDIDSLSAILLDEDYYNCLAEGSQVLDGIRVLKPEYILAFKARAYLDMVKREQEGIAVKADDIKKHRQDVFRLYNLLVLGQPILLPESIVADIQQFLASVRAKPDVDLRAAGIRSKTLEAVLEDLLAFYQPEPQEMLEGVML